MDSTPHRNPLDHLLTTSLTAVTQTAVGCGVGLLVASKLRRSTQKATALAMFSLGLASVLPMAISFFAKQWNRPESARAMRRRLESIREDPGLSENTDIY